MTPEHIILGPGLPEGTQFIRPITALGESIPMAFPIGNLTLESLPALAESLRFETTEVVGFEPCTINGIAIVLKTHTGEEVAPKVYTGMDFIADNPQTAEYTLSRRYSHLSDGTPDRRIQEFTLRPDIDTAILPPTVESPEGSRFRRAA